MSTARRFATPPCAPKPPTDAELARLFPKLFPTHAMDSAPQSPVDVQALRERVARKIYALVRADVLGSASRERPVPLAADAIRRAGRGPAPANLRELFPGLRNIRPG